MARIALLLAALALVGCGGSDRADQHAASGAVSGATTTGASGDPSAERDVPPAEGGGGASGAGEADAEAGGGRGPSIPLSDRLAFTQIGAAAAELNVSASVLAVTFAVRPKDTLALRRFRPNVKALRPQDRRLAQLRARTLKALDEAIAARRNPRRARRHAKAALASAAAITRGLRRYEHAHHGIRAVIPD